MSSPDRKTRVMLVDDSAVIRGLISRSLESDSSIEIVASVANGQLAVDTIKRADPDIVVLDIEMPEMDGITALPLLLKEKPNVKVLMCSTLSTKGAAISLKALSLGAADCIGKPTSTGDMGGAGEFQAELLRLVRGLSPAAFSATAAQASAPPPLHKPSMAILPGRFELLAIGSSTGGPQALLQVMPAFRDLDVPIVITQHMPKTFTATLAEHIKQHCHLPCTEGAEGMVLEPGHAYVAPGGYHMLFEKTEDGKMIIRLDDGPQVNYCKPAVDPMLNSAVNLYGNRVLALILTGMGSDGLESCRELVEKGGRVVAQDEETSVVWGMPGAVAAAGLCTQILPLSAIGETVRDMLKK